LDFKKMEIKIPPLRARKPLTELFGRIIRISQKHGLNDALKIIGIEIHDIEKFSNCNKKTIQHIERNNYDIIIETIPSEKNVFLYISPKELTHNLLKGLNSKINQIMSMTVLIGKINNYELRFGVYGIPCDELGRSMIQNGRLLRR